VVELLDPEGENDVVEPGAHHRARLIEGCRRAGAGVLDVDDGNPPDAHSAQNDFAPNAFLTGDETRSGVPHVGRFQLGCVDPRVFQRELDRLRAQGL
jgi:hypothetical protein